MGNISADIVAIIVFISIGMFFLLREVMLWYWKVNKQIRLQQAILKTLLMMFEREGGDVNWEAVNDLLDSKTKKP